MEFVKAMEIKYRMCNKCCQKSCSCCPLSSGNNKTEANCRDFISEYPKESESILEAWDKEHPIKTMLTDFMEKYPNAKLKTDGMPKLCPYVLGYCKELCYGEDGCAKCWNRPIENVEE